jgi:hypothetical protein
MTRITITQTPSHEIPEPVVPPRGKPRVAVAAGFAVAAIVGVATLVAVSGSDSIGPAVASPERSAPSAMAPMSADAAERAALHASTERIAACRATTVAPDSLERCIGHRHG